MLELASGDPIIKAYLGDIQRLKNQFVSHELGLKGPYQNLLDKPAKRRGWMLVPELSTYSGGKRVVPDGTVRDEYRLARGWWEAKDTADQLAAEIQKKLRAGYPTRNTIFEDTQGGRALPGPRGGGGIRPKRFGGKRRAAPSILFSPRNLRARGLTPPGGIPEP